MVRRLTFWLLALAGVTLGHVAGYVLAHPGDWMAHLALEAHAYFPGVTAFAVPIGIGCALWHAIRVARSDDLGAAITIRSLAAAQLVLFSIQEVAERLADGVAAADLGASLAGELGVVLGLLAQVGVAALLTLAVRATARVLRALTAGGPRITAGSMPPQPSPAGTPYVLQFVRSAISVRGPPSFVW